MRYLIQFVVPALIVAGVVYLLGHRRNGDNQRQAQQASGARSDTGTVLVILALGAAVAIATVLTLQSFWS